MRVVRMISGVAAVTLLSVLVPWRASATCGGDCNGNGVVSIDELIRMVNIALGEVAVTVCAAGDANGDGAITISEIVSAVGNALDGCQATGDSCAAGTYTYTFTNYCAEPIFMGQNGPGSASTPPSFPESGNWAMAPPCTAANQAAVCTGNGSTCNVPVGDQFGQCTCSMDSDCPGSAACIGGLCSTTTTFCMPQNWSSGVFWPRTGCTLSDSTTLTCTTGQCNGVPGSSGGQLDCGAGSNQFGPAPPIVLFEATTTGSAVNYDVSLNSGYNVSLAAVPNGGGYVFPLTTTAAACPPAGCIADLQCPTYLQTTGGCLAPCSQCTNSAPGGSTANATTYAALQCDQTITTDFSGNTPSDTTACSGTVTGGLPTYQDMYCDANAEGDNNATASGNQGTPTAFSQLDCFPGTTFVVPTYPNGYTPPAGAGVCLYESSTPGVNDYGWTDLVNGTESCGSLLDGVACGGYRTNQGGGAYFPEALGYTCRTVTLPSNFPTTTAHLCLPPTVSGLGTCETDQTTAATPTPGSLSLYAAAGGVTNAAWLTAGLQAATSSTSSPYAPGSIPYYETLKNACPYAYAWQYDDAASGYSCTVNATVPPAGNFAGFNVSLCPPAASPTSTPTNPPTPGGPTATPTPTPMSAGALSWNLDMAVSTNLVVPLAGMSYTLGDLLLVDSGARFCTTSGKQPIVSVDVEGKLQTIGSVTSSTSQVQIANIPAAAGGSYDVVVQLFADCGDTQTMLTMPDALTYSNGATATPTSAASTPTATNSAAQTPTGTATQPSGTLTPTTGVAQTATATATQLSGATPTPTSGGILSWNLTGAVSTNLQVPLGGMSYTLGDLLLNDSGARFCTTSGLQPIASVDLGNGDLETIGAVTGSASALQIANIPAAPAGTYDVVIQLNVNCDATQTMLTMPSALTYSSN